MSSDTGACKIMVTGGSSLVRQVIKWAIDEVKDGRFAKKDREIGCFSLEGMVI